jgi:hypothetical protein
MASATWLEGYENKKMSETAAIEFLVTLITPFMAACGLGYFIRKSIKAIALMFGMFFFVVGMMWYTGVVESYSGIQKWIADVMEVMIRLRNLLVS